MKDTDKDNTELTIRDIFPELSDDDVEEAEDRFHRYLDLSLRMYKRIYRDDPGSGGTSLTQRSNRSTMTAEGRSDGLSADHRH